VPVVLLVPLRLARAWRERARQAPPL